MTSLTADGLVTEKIREYWEVRSCGTDRTDRPQYSLEYFEEIEEYRYAYNPFIHSFAQFTRWRGKKVLEVGVGAGTDFLQFVRAGANVYGVDLTEEGIRNVEHRLQIYGLAAEDLRVCNAEHLPYEDDSFDLVYSWGVIHHAENMEKVLSEIYRVTRPGGCIKLMVYNINSLYAWAKYFFHSVPRGRILGGRGWAIYNFQESFATKAYTRRDIECLMASSPHTDLKFQFWDQWIRKGARFERIRRVISKLIPERLRWYMAFECRKAL